MIKKGVRIRVGPKRLGLGIKCRTIRESGSVLKFGSRLRSEIKIEFMFVLRFRFVIGLGVRVRM